VARTVASRREISGSSGSRVMRDPLGGLALPPPGVPTGEDRGAGRCRQGGQRDALGFIAAAGSDTGHGDSASETSHEARGDEVGAAVGVNCEAMLTSAKAFEGFVDTRADLLGVEIAKQPEAAAVGVACERNARKFAAEDVDGGVLQTVVAADAVEPGFAYFFWRMRSILHAGCWALFRHSLFSSLDSCGWA